MKKKDASFVDQHIEKVVVGVSALVLLAALYLGLGGDRFTVDGKSPKQLVEEVGTEASTVASMVQNAQPKPAAATPAASTLNDPLAQLEIWFGEKAEGLKALVKTPVGRTQPFPAIFHSTTEIAREDRHGLASMVAPGLPVATAGRSAFAFAKEAPELEKYSGEVPTSTLPAVPRNWVAVAAQIDLVQQDINYKTQKYPDGAFPTIVRVHMERFDHNEQWRGWQPVDTFLPYAAPEVPEIVGGTGAITLEKLTEFKEMIEQRQDFVARPRLPKPSSGDRIEYPAIPYFPDPPSAEERDASSRIRRWLQLAQRAKDGKSPFSSEDPDAAVALLRGVIGSAGVSERDLSKAQSLLSSVLKSLKKLRKDYSVDDAVRPPERMMPIVAYDMTPVPGHTYTYRIRYEVLNMFAGNTGELLDPADATKVTVFSGWSPETRPVTIESDTYFYLTKADNGKAEVTVAVYKKKGRDAARQATFKVKVGDEIGGEKRRGKTRMDFSTGAVCLDINFNRKINGKTDVSIVYVDLSDGSVHEKLLSVDKKDKFRESLDSEKTARR